MKGEPKNVAISEVEVGALVAVDVIDSNGQLLVPAETELTEKLIALLERRQVERIDVVIPIQLTDEEKEQLITDIRSKLDVQFASAGQCETAMQLKDILFRYRCRGL
ncbi:MAG: hypothetical protein V7739_00605 [Motiliproteus sp.]